MQAFVLLSFPQVANFSAASAEYGRRIAEKLASLKSKVCE